jgi:hypothetical protein
MRIRFEGKRPFKRTACRSMRAPGLMGRAQSIPRFERVRVECECPLIGRNGFRQAPFEVQRVGVAQCQSGMRRMLGCRPPQCGRNLRIRSLHKPLACLLDEKIEINGFHESCRALNFASRHFQRCARIVKRA